MRLGATVSYPCGSLTTCYSLSWKCDAESASHAFHMFENVRIPVWYSAVFIVSVVSACKQSVHANISCARKYFLCTHLGSHRQPQGVFTREPKHTYSTVVQHKRPQEKTIARRLPGVTKDASGFICPLPCDLTSFSEVSTLSRIVGSHCVSCTNRILDHAQRFSIRNRCVSTNVHIQHPSPREARPPRADQLSSVPTATLSPSCAARPLLGWRRPVVS